MCLAAGDVVVVSSGGKQSQQAYLGSRGCRHSVQHFIGEHDITYPLNKAESEYFVCMGPVAWLTLSYCA